MAANPETSAADPGRTGAKPLVLHVVRQFSPSRGGLEDVVANLCAKLPGLGYRVRVLTCDRLFTDPDGKLPPHEIVDGIEVVRIPWSGSKRYPFAPSVFRHLEDADLVHVHAVDFFFDALAWGRVLHRKPMVATTHGGFFHTTNHAALKKAWFQSVTRLSARAYRSLVCCSVSDLQLFDRIAAGRTVLIENGVDSRKFANNTEGAPQKRLVTIGRFSVNKRLDRLLDTMQALMSRDAGWHLDVIGSGSDLSAGDLARMVSERGLQGSVTVHPSPENGRIREILADAALFVSASEYEGFGLVAVEVMGAGLLPVLHGNQAYLSLAAKHEGLVVADFSDPAAAASAIQHAFTTLSASPDPIRNRLRQEAGQYDWAQVASRYGDVYARALGGMPAQV